MRLGRGRHRHGAPGPRRREPRGRRPPRADGADQEPRLRRAGGRRRRAGDGDRDATASGHFVRGLPQSAFHVSEDGRPQAITHFASENVPLELIVAVDISGSMTPAMPKLKKAVKEFLGAVPAADQVTLLGFNDSDLHADAARDRIPPSASRRWIGWRRGESTALYDVILRGVDMLGPPDRPQGARRLHRRRRSGEPRRRSTTSSGGCSRAT